MRQPVHIIPLGFEIDRAVAPFEARTLFANRVFILTLVRTRRDAAKNREQAGFLAETKRRLEACGIRVTVEDVDTFDTDALLRAISSHIVREKRAGHEVYVNASAAGRLQTIAAALAGMVHGATTYYVQADDYPLSAAARRKHGLSTCDGHRIQVIENLPFELPKPRQMQALLWLSDAPGGLTTRDLILRLRDSGDPGFGDPSRAGRTTRTNYLVKLNMGVLNPLAKAGYVDQSTREGRQKRIRITPRGQQLACLITPELVVQRR